MKLSEAIMLGSTLKPQAFQMAFDGVGTCAYGAALDALGMLEKCEHFNIASEWPWLRGASLRCPECREIPHLSVCVVSLHLNDLHRWPRERIAKWVATVEPLEDPNQSTEEVMLLDVEKVTASMIALTK